MLDGPNGRGSASALGAQQDVEQALLTGAVLMRYPPRTPSDALNLLGADSSIERFLGEPDGTATPPTGYQGRLMARWSTWKKAGSEQAIVDSLHAYGIPDVAVDQDFERAFWPPDWPWYSRFRVRLGPNFGGLGWLGAGDATAEQQAAVKRQVLKWKAAHAYSVDVLLVFAGDLIDMGFTIDSSLIQGNTTMEWWHLGRLIDIDFMIDSSLIGGYEV